MSGEIRIRNTQEFLPRNVLYITCQLLQDGIYFQAIHSSPLKIFIMNETPYFESGCSRGTLKIAKKNFSPNRC